MLLNETPEMDLTQIRELLTKLLKHTDYKNRFAVKRGQTITSIPITDIAYFYSKDKISYIKTYDGKDHLISLTLGEIEKSVSPDYFYRASRQIIINYQAISKVCLWWNGKLKLQLKPDPVSNEVIISRERVPGFKVWLGE